MNYEEINNDNQINQQIEQPKQKKLIALRVIIAILYFAATIFMLVMYGKAVAEQNWAWLGYVIWIIYMSPVYFIQLILAIVGLGLSIKNKKSNQCKQGQVIYFIVFIVLPIVTELILLYVLPLFAK